MDNRVVPPLPPPLPPSLAELLARLIADVTNNTTTTAAATNRDGDDDEDGVEDSIPHPDHDDFPRKRHRLTVIESLLRQEQLPVRQRNTIDDLVERFQRRVSIDIHEMITDQRMSDETYDDEIDGSYEGLDNRRDSLEEVETALRIYPAVLARRKDFRWDDEDDEWELINYDEGDYPIQCLPFQIGRKGYVHNRYALSFIHLFAKLAIEFNAFDDAERGGLLIEDPQGDNVFRNLARATPLDHRRDDDMISTELIRLRQMDLMKKDDIREHNLFEACHLCHQTVIVENCVRFLVEWDPECLFQIDRQEILPFPLQVAATRSVRYFRFLFDYFIRYYPYKKGISMLFRTNPVGCEEFERSPFNIACGGSTTPDQQKDVMEVVDDVLARYHSTTPINTIEALLLTATNPTIDLDGVYFLLRRQPEVVLKMMPYSNTVTNTTTSKQDCKRKRSECYRS